MKSRLLSEESIATLKRLLGASVHTIFAPPIDAAGAHLAAWALSMLLGKNDFINFSCEWFETPLFLNDCWQILVERSTKPLRIEQKEDGALFGCSTIKIYSATPITRIAIFETHEAGEAEGPDESVHYDQAIVFHCEGGRRFCICCMLNGPGIATDLHFSEDAEVITEMTKSSTTRLVLVDRKTS